MDALSSGQTDFVLTAILCREVASWTTDGVILPPPEGESPKLRFQLLSFIVDIARHLGIICYFRAFRKVVFPIRHFEFLLREPLTTRNQTPVSHSQFWQYVIPLASLIATAPSCKKKKKKKMKTDKM